MGANMDVRKVGHEARARFTPKGIELLEGAPWCRFGPIHAAVTGNPYATLLLAYALNKAKMSQHPERWWRATFKEITAWTNLNRRQIDIARKTLTGLGFWHERRDKKHIQYHITMGR